MRGQVMARWLVIGILGVMLTGSLPAPTASANGLVEGVADIFMGALALPMGILGGTLSGPPVLGTVQGVLSGAYNTIGYATRGTLRLAGVAIPTAAQLAPLIPLFL